MATEVEYARVEADNRWIMAGRGRGRGVRSKKVELPRPRKIHRQQSGDSTGSLSSPTSANTSDPLLSPTETGPLTSDCPNLAELELVTRILSSNSVSDQDVIRICETMKIYGSRIETVHQTYLDEMFVILRDVCKDPLRSQEARLYVLELLELRASRWTVDRLTQNYYCKKLKTIAGQMQVSPANTSASSDNSNGVGMEDSIEKVPSKTRLSRVSSASTSVESDEIEQGGLYSSRDKVPNKTRLSRVSSASTSVESDEIDTGRMYSSRQRVPVKARLSRVLSAPANIVNCVTQGKSDESLPFETGKLRMDQREGKPAVVEQSDTGCILSLSKEEAQPLENRKMLGFIAMVTETDIKRVEKEDSDVVTFAIEGSMDDRTRAIYEIIERCHEGNLSIQQSSYKRLNKKEDILLGESAIDLQGGKRADVLTWASWGAGKNKHDGLGNRPGRSNNIDRVEDDQFEDRDVFVEPIKMKDNKAPKYIDKHSTSLDEDQLHSDGLRTNSCRNGVRSLSDSHSPTTKPIAKRTGIESDAKTLPVSSNASFYLPSADIKAPKKPCTSTPTVTKPYTSTPTVSNPDTAFPTPKFEPAGAQISPLLTSNVAGGKQSVDMKSTSESYASFEHSSVGEKLNEARLVSNKSVFPADLTSQENNDNNLFAVNGAGDGGGKYTRHLSLIESIAAEYSAMGISPDPELGNIISKRSHSSPEVAELWRENNPDCPSRGSTLKHGLESGGKVENLQSIEEIEVTDALHRGPAPVHKANLDTRFQNDNSVNTSDSVKSATRSMTNHNETSGLENGARKRYLSHRSLSSPGGSSTTYNDSSSTWQTREDSGESRFTWDFIGVGQEWSEPSGPASLSSHTTASSYRLKSTGDLEDNRNMSSFYSNSDAASASSSCNSDVGSRFLRRSYSYPKGALGFRLPDNITREPLGPLEERKLALLYPLLQFDRPTSAIARRHKFAETSRKYRALEDSKPVVEDKVKVSYGKHFLLACAKSPLSRKKPDEWAYLVRTIPDVCIPVGNNYFEPDLYLSPSFTHGLKSAAYERHRQRAFLNVGSHTAMDEAKDFDFRRTFPSSTVQPPLLA